MLLGLWRENVRAKLIQQVWTFFQFGLVDQHVYYTFCINIILYYADDCDVIHVIFPFTLKGIVDSHRLPLYFLCIKQHYFIMKLYDYQYSFWRELSR